MKEFSPCFGESDVEVVESSFSSTTRASQNVATCVYQSESQGCSCLITVSWTKNLMGEDLSVEMDDSGNQRLCKMEIQPWSFSTRKGSQTLLVGTTKVDLFWDLTSAKLAYGPEPLEGFYLAVVFNQELVLLLGNLKTEACKKIEADPSQCATVLIARREHIYGKKCYSAKSQFRDKGQIHDITIEFCFDTIVRGPCLVIEVDKKIATQVKRLDLKFRGNKTIWVDGFPVEVIWDVHGWLFGNDTGNAVFMFQTHFSLQKMWACQSDENSPAVTKAYTHQLQEQTQIMQVRDFSLILFAWKKE
ncbi:uncharacterized protein LOC129310224 [Prosopis cineraria]|uniref:uncharacterized protein LOC129310224 n=1 Tax=Prosopis cineraria TaxID=364024 RepID=UPI00240F2441|nr:uncharacterized protein LOC129310224 [Prosopis cineraria]